MRRGERGLPSPGCDTVYIARTNATASAALASTPPSIPPAADGSVLRSSDVQPCSYGKIETEQEFVGIVTHTDQRMFQ